MLKTVRVERTPVSLLLLWHKDKSKTVIRRFTVGEFNPTLFLWERSGFCYYEQTEDLRWHLEETPRHWSSGGLSASSCGAPHPKPGIYFGRMSGSGDWQVSSPLEGDPTPLIEHKGELTTIHSIFWWHYSNEILYCSGKIYSSTAVKWISDTIETIACCWNTNFKIYLRPDNTAGWRWWVMFALWNKGWWWWWSIYPSICFVCLLDKQYYSCISPTVPFHSFKYSLAIIEGLQVDFLLHAQAHMNSWLQINWHIISFLVMRLQSNLFLL